MASLTKTIELGTDADKAWELISDPGRANELITFLGEVTVTGDTRVCAIGEDHLEELIVDVDHAARRFVYSIKASPFGFTHHSASMQVVADEEGTRLVWVTDFAPDAAAGALGEALDGAAASIAEVLG